ncbi:MAG TPA: phosphatase PAP2 family protein [Verrucomicrobiae bacterium]
MLTKLKYFFTAGWAWTRNQDVVVLLLVFACVSSAWLFIEVADEVGDGETAAFDKAALRAFRDPNDLSDPLGPRRIEEAVRDITALGSTTVLLLFSLLAAGFLLFTRRFNACLLLISALGGGLLLNWTLKNYFDRPRPEYVTQLHYVDSNSFPSGHALLSTVVYLSIGALASRLVAKRRQKIYIVAAAVLLVALVGVSRVYLGVHYPTDVLAGWSVGTLWAIICWFAARYLQLRGKLDKPAPSSASSSP